MFAKCCGCTALAVEDTKEEQRHPEVPVEPTEEQPPEDNKRQSVVSDIKIEVSENGDDEVFHDGVGPPVQLANNLGTHPRGSLPRWYSEEDDQEVGGVQEPPATPVGRDELALRRHRLFSELLNAAQDTSERRVRFDPLGPVVAGVSETHNCCSQINAVIDRLETQVEALNQSREGLTQLITNLYKLFNTHNNKNFVHELTSLPDLDPHSPDMSLSGFADVMQGTLAQFMDLSKKLGGDVAEMSQLVYRAFQAEYNFLSKTTQMAKPSDAQQAELLKETSNELVAIQQYREKHRPSPFFNHLSAISESIAALAWVTIAPTPAPYIKEMIEAGKFYTNRVLTEWKEKDKKHCDWVNSWIQTLNDLHAFVKQHHTTGLVWRSAPGGGAPPPPPSCPPPPPVLDDIPANLDGNTDRSALFAEINQGENITRNLKKVTSEMQTHKNPALRQGPAPFKAPSNTPGYGGQPAAAIDKPPSFQREGKKWLIEYQKGNHNLLVDNPEMNNVVYLFKCVDSTATVKGKLNSITLDSCKKSSIVFDNLVSSIEFINCNNVQMQVMGTVPTISIDKTDGCQIYLSKDSLNVEIVTSKSSAVNVLVPTPSGDYVEYPVPEQFKTTVVPGKGLATVVVEQKG